MFLVIEGLDGCGKSTQARRLVELLASRGKKVVHLREPGGTPIGERLRDLLLARGEVAIGPHSEALLYSAARAELVATVIAPALARGDHVVCERYYHSTIAYQGAGLDLDQSALDVVSRFATGGLEADRVALLDLDPAIALARLPAGRDRIESRGIDYFRRVRAAFLAMARESPARFRIVDAARDADAVFASLREALVDDVP